MTETKQIDPCVSLEFDEGGGLLLTVSAQLRPGVRNWSPEEAGAWFARSWQRAEMTLTASLVQRALALGSKTQLVGQGDMTWWVEGLSELSLTIPEAPSPSHRENGTASAKALSTITEPSGEGSVPSPRIPERLADDNDQKIVIRHLNRTGRPMSVADLKREAKLSEYRVKKALAALGDKGAIQEERVEVGGRWKEAAVYSGTGDR